MTKHTIIPAPPGAEVDRRLAAIIGEAFAALDVSKYLVPDDDTRAAVLTAHLGAQVPLARSQGSLLTDPSLSSVSVWFKVPVEGLPDQPSYEQRRAAACGVNTDRFAAFETILDEVHPYGRAHWYLQFMATRPEMQGHGLGAAHLAYQLAIVDDERLPAYLEAGDKRSARLYAEYGFDTYGPPFPCGPAGPMLYPQWREHERVAR
ncbi:MAG: GNAT family N-acetyltransferase [Catenulispora sp.]|nr:GNAT family N-acetyltransferase [Catenulispora sp.]NUT40013.1 GNAT family N-acetyltransferase [Thermoactinospora sp.]